MTSFIDGDEVFVAAVGSARQLRLLGLVSATLLLCVGCSGATRCEDGGTPDAGASCGSIVGDTSGGGTGSTGGGDGTGGSGNGGGTGVGGGAGGAAGGGDGAGGGTAVGGGNGSKGPWQITYSLVDARGTVIHSALSVNESCGVGATLRPSYTVTIAPSVGAIGKNAGAVSWTTTNAVDYFGLVALSAGITMSGPAMLTCSTTCPSQQPNSRTEATGFPLSTVMAFDLTKFQGQLNASFTRDTLDATVLVQLQSLLFKPMTCGAQVDWPVSIDADTLLLGDLVGPVSGQKTVTLRRVVPLTGSSIVAGATATFDLTLVVEIRTTTRK